MIKHLKTLQGTFDNKNSRVISKTIIPFQMNGNAGEEKLRIVRIAISIKIKRFTALTRIKREKAIKT